MRDAHGVAGGSGKRLTPELREEYGLFFAVRGLRWFEVEALPVWERDLYFDGLLRHAGGEFSERVDEEPATVARPAFAGGGRLTQEQAEALRESSEAAARGE